MDGQQSLIELIFDRLTADGVPDEVAELVLAALSGERDLAEALEGRPPTLDGAYTTEGGSNVPHIWLSSVTVSGFRGIGQKQELTIKPGPGLTFVVGRNGSGKSSFAEAIELALTGDSVRWADRNSVWRTGWRNLHVPHPCEIAVELRIDGQATPIGVRRAWPEHGELTNATETVTGPDATNLVRRDLAKSLELYRPFLSATEFGKLIAGKPSELFDSLQAILGLDLLTDADRRLRGEIRTREDSIKQLSERKERLRTELISIEDDRAKLAAEVLAEPRLDRLNLDQLEAILDEPLESVAGEEVAQCRRLLQLPLPSVDQVAELTDQLGAVCADARQYDESRFRSSLRTAKLLDLALEHHAQEGDGPCPVCTTGVLDATWRERSMAILVELRTSTDAVRQAASERDKLAGQIRTLVKGIEVPNTAPEGVPLNDLRKALVALRELPDLPDDLARHVAIQYPDVAKTADAVRAGAEQWLRQRDTTWRRLAEQVREWMTSAREVLQQQAHLSRLRAARTWMRDAGDEIRNARLAPFAEHSQRVWEQLRQESNVQLGTMTLSGSGTRRRVKFPASVDGVDSNEALGVMSQGELQAFGLAIFLPRSCAEESPFRFIVIDDPVQSMDPAKVDGLAQVLGELAEKRQVVVFTHDSRLPEAARMLEIDADVWEVIRAEQSVVTLRRIGDPVQRYLDDAWAVAKSAEVDKEVRAPVVAELCRSALEAACHRVIWRRKLKLGVRHADIEAAIEQARRLATTFALALFDDPDRGGDVLSALNRKYGHRAADAYQSCRGGVHTAYVDDLPALVTDTRDLTKRLEQA